MIQRLGLGKTSTGRSRRHREGIEPVASVPTPRDPFHDRDHVGKSPFDVIRKVDENGNEYWSAREMAEKGYFDYEWRDMKQVVNRAMEACQKANHAVEDQFRKVPKLVQHGSGAQRDIGDIRLTRYACYLVAMNGDPKKPQIAAAQNYFVTRTRQAEIHLPPIGQPMADPTMANLKAAMDLRATQIEHDKRITDMEAKGGPTCQKPGPTAPNAGPVGPQKPRRWADAGFLNADPMECRKRRYGVN